MNTGLGMELEEGGLVALLATLLLPGAAWIAKAKTGKSMAVRAAVLGLVIAGALAIEASMDHAAEPALDKL